METHENSLEMEADMLKGVGVSTPGVGREIFKRKQSEIDKKERSSQKSLAPVEEQVIPNPEEEDEA